MQGYIILIIAIIGEVFGSSMLKASNGFKRVLPIFGVIIGYGVSRFNFKNDSIEFSLCDLVWSRNSVKRIKDASTFQLSGRCLASFIFLKISIKKQ